ncbi:peptidylprolyl isomerase [Oceanidesulfovibrio marinus]|uniref:Peptidyl-prolyl cis-trans isomerase n=1 Tax=Oceanidesulfovibrio marinus TaxID=370038 RepID=A0A6P1ZK03_9BACT|nr:peptidylprolyl isomerase [Oceanidesulfovibrio marinus]QJT08190.1 peptidyl-prolyl cis-trans isomerase [Oceanidesulfovibrio marinus]TVM35085.1 peptidyl-prolyl cis-trans isomerase [Oceanidesulfovibrio marinus]
MKHTLLRIVLVFVLLAAFGCDFEEPREEGVVARVNGAPIYLHELEDAYDIQHLGWTADSDLTVGRLKGQYAKVLTTLVVQKLVEQALAARDITVPEDRVNEAEAKVRVDYPKGEFEKILVEEYIDLAAWREHLRANIARQVFMEQVLRPRISLDYEEIEAYYKAHMKDFDKPARIRFALVSGPGRRMVRDAASLFLKGSDERQLEEAFPRVTLQEMTVREDRLPANWREALDELQPSEASPVSASATGFETVILEERIPAKSLDAAQAFPIVERMLLEKKEQTAFEEWLQESLGNATVLVSRLLLPGESDEEGLAKLDLNATVEAPYWEENATSLETEDGQAVPEEELVPDELDVNATPDGIDANMTDNQTEAAGQE